MPNLSKAITFLFLINIFFVQFDKTQAQQKTQANLHNSPKKTEIQAPAKINNTSPTKIIKSSSNGNHKGYSLKDILSMLESVFTIIAIIVGGVWTYQKFIIRRQKYPHANMLHEIKHLTINDNKLLLNVKVHIENIGEILLEMKSGFTAIYRILPISDDDMLLIETNKMERSEKGNEIEWPEIDCTEVKYAEGDLEIEPSENDEVCFDFILNSEDQAICIYSYFENIKKSKHEHEIGWHVTSIYDLRNLGKSERLDSKETKVGG
jgi:hypothetical protein